MKDTKGTSFPKLEEWNRESAILVKNENKIEALSKMMAKRYHISVISCPSLIKKHIETNEGMPN